MSDDDEECKLATKSSSGGGDRNRIQIPEFDGTNWREWKDAVVQAAYTGGRLPHPQHGYLHLVLSEDQWRRRAGADVEKPERATKPEMYLAGANGSVVGKFNYGTSIYVEEQKFINAMMGKIKASLGALFEGEFEDRDTRLPNKSLLEITTFMTENFGTMDRPSIRAMHEKMENAVLADGSKFAMIKWKAETVRTCSILADNNETVTKSSQIALVEKLVARYPAHAVLAKDYFRAHPLLAEQNFEDLTRFIITHLSSVVVSVGEVMGTAMATTPPGDVALRAQVRALTEEVRVLKQCLATTQTDGGGGAPRAAKGKFYCYEHGYCGHSGKFCTKLLASGTEEQRNARKHTDVPGGAGKRA